VRLVTVGLVAFTVTLAASVAWGDPKTEPAKPPVDVATLLFDTPHWDKAPVGATLTYDYAKAVTRPTLGLSFKDQIVLKLEKGDEPSARTAEVRMFSGPNAKPAGPFRSDAQNPIVLLMMEENVQELSQLFKANPRYLKNAIRKAWRDDAKIVPTQVSVNGQTVAGTRITVTPFLNDPQKDKMMGLEGLTYTIDVANDVPGTIADIDIHAPVDGPSLFSEKLTFKGMSK
jgi:hypothetical protein